MAKTINYFLIVFSLLLLTSCARREDIFVISTGSSNGSIINETTIINNYYGTSNETLYNVSAVQTITGTSTTADLNLLKIYDSQTWNISEASGSLPIDFRINFTNVVSFNKILMRERYLGGSGHEVILQIWDYSDSTWESYDIITDQGTLVITEIPVLDDAMHINAGKVQLRFLHLDNGIPSHSLYIDFIFLEETTASVNNLDHDSLSNRDSICTNHPEVCLNYLNKTTYWTNATSSFLQSYTETDPVWNLAKTNYYNTTQSNINYMNRSSWTSIDNYPTACSAGQYVSALGDTLTCSTPTGGSTAELIFKDEFMYYATARTEGIGICAALSSGTAASVLGEQYMGVMRFSDSTTASGGFQCRTDLNSYFIGGEKLTFRFKVANRATNVHQFGFSDSTTAADPTDGCWISGANLVMTAKCKNNAGPTANETTYTLTALTWYTAEIEALSTTQVRFRIYNADKSTLLWSVTVSANVPNTSARVFGVRLSSWETSTDAAAIMSYFDYVKLEDVSYS